MPTRLDVLLQSRKSAAAELFHRPITANASTGRRPAVRRAGEGDEGRESIPVMRESYIKSLTISRGPTGLSTAGNCVSHDVGRGIYPDPDLFCAPIWQNL